MNIIGGVFGMIYILAIIGLIGLSIYTMILFINVARRGIKALDIYIDKNNNKFN